jgi:N-carbamoylputrescine amidase
MQDGRGLNVAIVVDPAGRIVSRTPKLHIPVTAGYYEDQYFAQGPSDGEPYPVYEFDFDGTTAQIGLPTCWDEWFAEVVRNYSLRGAEVLAYPTAIGSEPDHPEFDTEPLWRQVIVGNAIANGTFMVVPNRYGDEVLVADLDLDQRRDWLDLFPFLATRRPDTYDMLVEPVTNARTENGDGEDGGIAGVSY